MDPNALVGSDPVADPPGRADTDSRPDPDPAVPPSTAVLDSVRAGGARPARGSTALRPTSPPPPHTIDGLPSKGSDRLVRGLPPPPTPPLPIGL